MSPTNVPLFFTNTFWALIAFIIFILLLLYLKLHHSLKNYLEQRARKIEQNLTSARQVREEAQALLAEYEKKRLEVTQEAQSLLENAKTQAELLVKEEKEKAESHIAWRLQMAEQRINQMEQEAIKEIRAELVDCSIAAARKILQETLTASDLEKICDNSLEKIKRQFV